MLKISWYDSMFFDFQTKTPVSNFFLWLLALNFLDLSGQTQKKPESTV